MRSTGCAYRCRLLFEGDFSVIVYSSLLLPLLLNIDPRCSQLSALLQSRQPSTAQSKGHSVICTFQTWSAATLTSCECFGDYASDLASSSCFSLAFLLAFLPWVLANRALASDSISNSSIGWNTQTEAQNSLLLFRYSTYKLVKTFRRELGWSVFGLDLYRLTLVWFTLV